MTYIDTGIRGATAQSWRGANPRDLLKRIIDDHPGADRAALFRLFVEKLKEEDEAEYMETIIEYWFTNNYHSLLMAKTLSSEESAAAATQREELVAATKAKLREKITEEAQIILLEMMMPNGKRLADCTGQECALLARHMASWLGKVARRVQPEQTVGDVLSEDDLRGIYQKRA